MFKNARTWELVDLLPKVHIVGSNGFSKPKRMLQETLFATRLSWLYKDSLRYQALTTSILSYQ